MTLLSERYKNMKNNDRCFLTGCDSKTEWQLPWFIENLRKHSSVDLVIADFGMSDEMVSFASMSSSHLIVLRPWMTEQKYPLRSLEFKGSLNSQTSEARNLKGWMKKPLAMTQSPCKKTDLTG